MGKKRRLRSGTANTHTASGKGVARAMPRASLHPDTASQRISWIDTAKALGIITVFYGHIVEKLFLTHGLPAAGYQYKLIYSFHMPLFFVLSGYLAGEIHGRAFPDFLRNKFMTRVVPFFFFNVLILPFYFIADEMSHQRLDVGQFIHKFLLMFTGRPRFNNITWFLACLFSVEMANYFLHPFLRKSRALLCAAIVLFYFAGWSISYKADPAVIPDYWSLRKMLAAYSFYLCGSLVAGVPYFRTKGNPYLDSSLFLLTVVCLVFSFNMNHGPFRMIPVVMFANGSYGNIFLFPLTALAGSLCVISASRLLSSNGIMTFLGMNTLPLMGLGGVLQIYANAVLLRYSSRLFSADHFSIFMQCAVLTGMSLVLCVPFVLLLKKHLPFLIGQWKDTRSRETIR
mgnify:CR=1 FL=1